MPPITEEPRAWRLERRGAGKLVAGALDGRQMDGVEAAARRGLLGRVPRVLCSVLKGLDTITAAVGPCQLQEVASGKWSSHRGQPVPCHLAAASPPLPQRPLAPGHCLLQGGWNNQKRSGPPQEGTRLEASEGILGLELSGDI